MDIIRVSGSSQTSKVAGAIAGVMRERDHVDVQAIGARAVNQAAKAITLARTFLEEDGIDIVFVPELVGVRIDDKLRTAMKFSVQRRV
ncbi:MAG TPA: stage V sporulation protein S [Anaerolineales bacterium]|jgi:stage V sporulation protein S|nr:stage V sporulation protein S [Anaerolineales bacterium]